MKRLLLLITTILLVFNSVAICSCSSEKANNQSIAYTQVDSTSSQPINHITIDTNHQPIKGYNHSYIWISLAILLVSNVFCLVLISSLFNSLDRLSDNNDNKKESIAELQADVKFLMDRLCKKDDKQTVGNVNYVLSDSDRNDIVDRLRECLRLDEFEKSHTAYCQNNESSVVKTVYAPAVGENMLFKVTEQPTDTTVYALRITGENKATFVIYNKAKDMVLKCEEFLFNACNVTANSRETNGIECIEGTAEKTADNTWMVTKKANVKFV